MPPGGIGVVLQVPQLGLVVVDIAFGGMWYVVVDAAEVGLELVPARGKDICRIGEMIKVCLCILFISFCAPPTHYDLLKSVLTFISKLLFGLLILLAFPNFPVFFSLR